MRSGNMTGYAPWCRRSKGGRVTNTGRPERPLVTNHAKMSHRGAPCDLVIQMARLGDLVQTLPAIESLQEALSETHLMSSCAGTVE